VARSPEDYFWAAHAKSTCDFTPKTTKALLGKAFVTLLVGPAEQSKPKEFSCRCV